jgi:hypothetical protein
MAEGGILDPPPSSAPSDIASFRKMVEKQGKKVVSST